MSFLQRTGRRFAASAVMVACFAASSAFAAMLATNDFETSFSDFTAAVSLDELATLTSYNGDGPSATASELYPFGTIGEKYLAVDSDTNMIWRAFGTQSANTYFDSYVQFTPMYGDFEYPDDAKFLIFLDSATSNLFVISGTSANDRTPVTNRLTTALVEPNSWGRLTVSAISGDVFSFQIRVNGTLYATSGNVNTFYSLSAGSLTQVGFSGTGALDNFAVRTTDPYIQNPVATIDGEGYASFENAISEASAGATIVLHGNASLSAAVSKALTIDLGGNTLSSSGYQTNLTIADSAETHGTVVFTNGGSVPSFTGESVNVLAGLENATLVMDGYVPRNIADGSTYSVVALANDCAIYSTRCNDDNTPTAGNANVKWQAFTLASASTAESLPVGAGSCYLFNIAGDNLAAASTGVSIKSITVKWGDGTHYLATIGGSAACDAYLVITTSDNKIVAISNVNDSRWAANGFSTFAFDGTVLNSATAYRAQFVTSVDGLSRGETLTSAVMARVNGRFHTGSKHADSTTACYGDSQQNGYSVNMSIVVEKAVASIGSIGYPTLNSALSAAGTESEATINLIAACSESVAIPANVTVAVADGVMFSGTLSGAGKVVYTASPSGTLTFGEWTGTVVLNYADIVNGGDFSAKVNSFGITGSTVEIGENGTINEGWCNADITPALKVTGYVHVNNGSSGTERNFTKVTGSGVFVFGTRGAMVNYKIARLENWNGVITNNASASWIESIVSGDGKIVLASSPADTTGKVSVGDGFTGRVEFTGGLNNYTYRVSDYCGANSTVVLKDATGYIPDAQGTGTYNGVMPSTVVIEGNVVINNAWPLSLDTENLWTNGKVVKFNTLRVDGSLSLVSTQNNDSWSHDKGGFYSIGQLDTAGGGSITVGQAFRLKIASVEFAAAPSGNNCLVPLTLAAATYQYSDNGQLYGPNGVSDEYIPVTVGGTPNGQMLYRGVDGLHLCAATVTIEESTTYYPTILAAIQAARETGAVVTVCDGTDASVGNFGEYGYVYDNGTWRVGAASVIHDEAGTSTTNAYATFAAAISASAAGDAVMLLQDNVETGINDAGIDTTGKNFVFDENGFAFSGTFTGNGTITVAVAPSRTTWSSARFVADGWTGAFVANFKIYSTQGAATKAIKPNLYGISGSTVVIGSALTDAKTFFCSNDASSAPNVAPALYLKADVTIDDGFYGDRNVTTFTEVGADNGVTFATRNQTDTSVDRDTYYTFKKLKNFNGFLNVRRESYVKIEEIVCLAAPTAGARVLATALDVNEAAFLRLDETKVTVNGEVLDVKLAYATLTEGSGLYLAVAQYGGNYYATFQDAINARGSGSGDITVLDASAPIPFGYKVSDGKLIRSRKIIFEFR